MYENLIARHKIIDNDGEHRRIFDKHIFINYNFSRGNWKFFQDSSYSDGIREGHTVHIYISRVMGCISDGSMEMFLLNCLRASNKTVYIHIPKNMTYLYTLLANLIASLPIRIKLICQHFGRNHPEIYLYDEGRNGYSFYYAIISHGDMIATATVKKMPNDNSWEYDPNCTTMCF